MEANIETMTPRRGPGNRSRQEAKTRLARETLCRATIVCLDRFGYSETSVGRIADEAGLSRGALTHHYKCKEDLIVDAIDQMLRAQMEMQFPSTGRGSGLSPQALVCEDLLWFWRNLDTGGGRALIEVLLASRTYEALGTRISAQMQAWNVEFSAFIRRHHEAVGADEESLTLLWEFCRIFFFGLMLHKGYARDPAQTQMIADRFAEIISGSVKPG